MRFEVSLVGNFFIRGMRDNVLSIQIALWLFAERFLIKSTFN